MRRVAPLLCLAALAGALGCVSAPPPPAALALAPSSEADRAMQRRVFETDDEAAVQAACIAVLQQHGFLAEDHEPALGLIVAAKDAPAERGGRTRLRASLATQPAGEFGGHVALRVTLQRLAWNARGRETLRENVREPGEYAGFFDEVAQRLAAPDEPALTSEDAS
jgi:hypothetical protein